MFILTLGSISSFKYASFDTAAKSVESTSATNLLQNDSQALYVPLTWGLSASVISHPMPLTAPSVTLCPLLAISHTQASVQAGLGQIPKALSFCSAKKCSSSPPSILASLFISFNHAGEFRFNYIAPSCHVAQCNAA